MICQILSCDCYDQNTFLNTFNVNTNAKLLHIHARGLPKSVSNIYINLLKVNFAIIGISET